jgi:hypothetical protein
MLPRKIIARDGKVIGRTAHRYDDTKRFGDGPSAYRLSVYFRTHLLRCIPRRSGATEAFQRLRHEPIFPRRFSFAFTDERVAIAGRYCSCDLPNDRAKEKIVLT